MTTYTDTSSTRITPRQAWRASTIDDPSRWYFPLPAVSLAAADQVVQAWRRQNQPVTAIRVDEGVRARLRDELRQAIEELEHGRGFVVIDRVPMDRYSGQEAQVVYWVVGELLGIPFEQNVQGTLLYDVRDTGQDLSQGARFSVTNYESSFHTDNSFGDRVLDYVGLLCLHTAKSGGISQVVSGYAVHRELAKQHPDVLNTLCQPFHVDRRGGTREGDSPTVRVPILQMCDDGLLVRYLRYWIQVGHEKIGQPLTTEQVHALDLFDSVLARQDLRAEFTLEPGQMFFINNRWILHNRTAFEDYSELERRRHYVRLWLKANDSTSRTPA